MSDEKKDIFKEAARRSLVKQKEEVAIPAEIIPEKTQLELALDVAADNADHQWEELVNAVKGRYAKKFMEKMDSLPDRDFMRMYPKILEYVKPKINRTEIRESEESKTINIQILQVDNEGNKRIIDISEDEDE